MIKRDTDFKLDDRLQNIVALANAVKAENMVLVDVRKTLDICDYFILCDAPSSTRVRAISENIVTEMKHEGEKAIHIDGLREGRWVVLDFGDVIVHVFQKEARDFYAIEELWSNAPTYELSPDNPERGKLVEK